MEELQKAEEAYLKALTLFVPDIAALQMGRARLRLDVGTLADASHLRQDAARIYERLGDAPGVAAALTSLGLVACLQNDLESALEAWKRARAKYETTSSSESLPLRSSAKGKGDLTALKNCWISWLSMYNPACQAGILADLNSYIIAAEEERA